MKAINILALVLIAVGSFSSCKKFLDTQPLSENSLENFYETEKQIRAALAGVYDRWAISATYGDRMLGRMGLGGDETYFRTPAALGITNNRAFASEAAITNNWAAWYAGINRANLLLENIDRADMDAEEKDVIRGEALFLRGYYHFMLVKYWGDVPIMTQSVRSPSEVYAERAPSVEVYEQIEEDMIKAEELVRTAAEVGHGGRVNKSAVRGVLARVYLHWAGYPINDESKYQDARDWAHKVMQPDPKDGFQHTLNPSYEDVFIKHCTDQYDVAESILEVEFYGNGTTDNGFSETGRVGSNNGIAYGGDDIGRGRYAYAYGFVLIPARTWYTFDDPEELISADERRDWSIANYRLTNESDLALERAQPIGTKQGRSSGKWRRELEVVQPKFKNAGPINYPLLRYSDVLLMFAEAENQLNDGPTSAAISAVNEVRRRAYGKDLPYESVRYIDVTNAGSSYDAPPTVTISGGGGSGATAEAFVDPATRRITRIKVMTQGSGYTSAPTVTISGSGNSGAATAILSQRAAASPEVDASMFSDPQSFQEFIEEERLRELCFEGLRKGDLIRWGKYLDYMERILNDFYFGDEDLGITAAPDHAGVGYYQSVSRKDLLWPIPSFEMALNRGLRTQNYGY